MAKQWECRACAACSLRSPTPRKRGTPTASPAILSARPLAVRLLGFLAALLFAVTAVQIFAGVQVTPLTSPLPFVGYPVLVATLVGWIWTLLRADIASVAPPSSAPDLRRA